MPKKIDISKFVKRLIIAGLVALIGGLIVSNKVVQRYGYDGLGDFIYNYWENKELAAEADPIVLEIDLSDKDYDFIKGKREEALERGIQINVGDNYVDCKLKAKDEEIDAQMRLKGHMTDHLQGDKWSFRIKSDEEILGMYRFSLQHPGTRNYAYEWVYHQLLKQEGIIYLNYDFVHLKLRGKDLGIYALEEHFGQHVLEHNNRPYGAILRWNPNLYWEWRIDELDGLFLDEQYSAYSSSFAEPYDRGTVKRDSALVETYIKGATLLEQFRRGERTTSEVFDVSLMAKFHAIIDLVGGYHSLDWSDVKFFYNSETELIEPVGYESFSVRKTEKIAGQRVPSDFSQVGMNYHDRLFADPVFFEEYIQQLQRICDEEFFNAFISSIKTELNKKLAILATEWPERKFTYDPYFENIDLIKHNLDLPKPFHAFFESGTDSTVLLCLAPVSDYPIEIIELEIDKKKSYPIEGFILPAKVRDTYAHYFPLKLTGKFKKFKNMMLKARIPGGSTIFEVEVAEYPGYVDKFEVEKDTNLVQDITAHNLIKYNEPEDAYFFDAIDVFIEEDYRLNHGTLKLLPGQNITFNKGSILLSNASLQTIGTTDHPIRISTLSHQLGFTFEEADVLMSNTELIGKANGMTAVNSTLHIDHCQIADFSEGFIKSDNCEVVLSNCDLGSSGLGLFSHSLLKLRDINANKGEYFLSSYGSSVKIISANLNHFEHVFDLRNITILQIWNSYLNNNNEIANVSSSSEFHSYGGDFGEAEFGFNVEEKDEFGGASKTRLYKTGTDKIKQLYQK